MQSEFDFQRAQLNKEIESLGQQLDDLLKVAQEKEELIFLIENLLKDLENGNTSRVHELRHNVEELKRNIETRMKENSISRDRQRQYNSSFEQDSTFVVRHSKELQIIQTTNNFPTDLEPNTSPLHQSNGFYSASNTSNILNESIRQVES
jgi:hypothetical protein